MRRQPLLLYFGMLLFIVVFAGCGERKYPFSGEVLFEDGSPVPLARLEFQEESGLRSGVAYADENGVFSDVMFDKPGDGIPAGTYRVAVNPPEMITLTPEQRALSPGPGWGIPQEFRSTESSGITMTVPLETEKFTVKIPRSGKGSDPDVEIMKQIESDSEANEDG